MSIQNKKRLPYLDYAKGIGIFLVVYAHAIGYLTEASVPESVLCRFIYSFHMPLFFMISGIGLFYKFSRVNRIDTGAEIRRITKRLMIPYAFWCVVYIVLKVFQSVLQNEDWLLTLMRNGYSAVTGRIGAPWFLYTLFIAEILIILLCGKLKDSGKEFSAYIWSAVLLIAVLLTVVFNIIFKRFDSDTAGILLTDPIILLFRIPLSFLFLCAGYLFGHVITKYRWLIDNKAKISALAAVFFAVFLTVQLISGNHVDLYHFTIDSVFAFIFTGSTGSIAFLLISMLLPDSIKILSEAGKESLHIMVLHCPPLPILYVPIVLSEKYSVPMRPLVCVVICIAAMAVIYYLSKLVIEPVTEKLTNAYANLSEQRKNTVG